MNPVIVQTIAAEKAWDLHAHAAAENRARIALRSRRGPLTSRKPYTMPGLRGRLVRGGA
jgi:hypothetical protein